MEDPRYEKRLEFKECPVCHGEKVFNNVSQCCHEPIMDNNTCSDCGELCNAALCDNCIGTGEVAKEFDDFTDEEDELCDKADENYNLRN